jgi:hypothetical protein
MACPSRRLGTRDHPWQRVASAARRDRGWPWRTGTAAPRKILFCLQWKRTRVRCGGTEPPMGGDSGRWWLDASPSRTTNLILYGSSSPGPCSPGKAVRTVSEKPEVKDSRFSVVNLPWDSGLDCTAGPNFCMVHESISSHGLQLHLIHPHPMTEKKNNPAGFSRATWSTLHPATNGCSALAWTAHRRSAWRCMGPSCSVIGGW